MSSPLIEVRDLRKSYSIDHAVINVLKGINEVFNAGEITAIMGPSGVGKTTLLNILGALDRQTSGEIFFQGKPYSKMDEQEFAHFRNQTIGFVFQFHHLLGEFTALENVMIPQLIAGVNKTDASAKARTALIEMGLQDRVEHKPSEMSGGEQQRVAVARSLINDPRLVLADEPSGNLDKASGEMLTTILWNLCQEKGHGFIIVTHNQKLADKADRQILISDGSIVQE
ncbi:MAG: ABC transporter ATP-binding protein [FCB group bacterium]|nr:ABC transporter ATP-binding protein [FCB group bacterium]